MAYTTINKSSDYFNTKLYTGTGSSNALTGVGFQPDWTWIKVRSEANNHELYDAVRGVTKRIYSDLTNAEDTNTAGLTAFGTDGFTVGTGGAVNGSSKTYVAWNWKAGGAGSANSDGSISSTVSANTTAGFSIVKWTGTASAGTIGHGLGVAPKVVLVKRYSTSGGGWLMQHGDLTGATYVIKLNTNGAEENDGANFNSAFPTSSVFSVYNSNNTNASGADHIAYCFAEKKGFSKFGSYTGNGGTDGPFVYTGFKPAFVLVKNATTSNNWFLQDSKRLGYNGANHLQKPNTNGADDTGTHIDMLSNGFKTIVSSANCNGSGNTMIYMAFAESPLVGSNNIPATAR
tara:strand:+ start:1040 stop:2074 length:1035 start_codon:yes stop_codon:yes gene_type:complete